MFFSLWNKNKVVLSDEHVLKLFEKHFSGKKSHEVVFVLATSRYSFLDHGVELRIR